MLLLHSQNTVQAQFFGTIFHDKAIGISHQNDDDQLDDETTKTKNSSRRPPSVRIF